MLRRAINGRMARSLAGNSTLRRKMATRDQIVAVARGFINTPFKHQGRTPGQALDCVGVPLCIGQLLKLNDKSGKPFLARDDCRYGPQPQSDIVLERCQARLLEVKELQPGVVLALKMPTVACHSAVAFKVGDDWWMVHADGKRVVEAPLTDKWRARIKGIFDFPGVTA
jgi:hypothetical protein